MTLEQPRQTAESSPEPPAGPERGTGEAGPETSAQRDFDCCADPASTIPMDIVARHLHQAIDTAAPRIAEELTPNLLASTAAAIRYIGEHGLPGKSEDFMAGVRYAATLLGHTATDLTEGATS